MCLMLGSVIFLHKWCRVVVQRVCSSLPIFILHVALSRQTKKYEEGSLVVHLQPQPGKSLSDKFKKVCCLIV